MGKFSGGTLKDFLYGYRRRYASVVKGFLETVTPAVISGWALDSGNPQRPVNVRVLVDGQIVGEGRADIPRPDTGKEHKTNGLHGFEIPVNLRPEKLDRVSVIASTGSDNNWISLPRITNPVFNTPSRQIRESDSEMRGYLESVTSNSANGWALDPNTPHQPVKVRAVVGNEVIGEARADLLRTETGKLFGTQGFHGFRIPVSLGADKLERVNVLGFNEVAQQWIPLPTIKPPSPKTPVRPYQSIGSTKGSSDSAGKLAALRLDLLQRPGAESPLEGFSVLDVGCNDGFFCLAALELGATSVTGIDKNKRTIQRAKQLCPQGTFIHGTWWDLPREQFDLILFLSALHYESREKALLDELSRHLKSNGTLVLECGVIPRGQGGQGWRQIKRADGPKRYATAEHVLQNLLRSFVARQVGKSVSQKGDPVPRYVFHCQRRRPMVLIIQGRSKTGKSTLADYLSSSAISAYRIDHLFTRLIGNSLYDSTKLAAFVRGLETRDFAAVSREIVAQGYGPDLAKLIAAEVPTECSLFCIEGEALTHPEILSPLKEELSTLGVDPWLVSKD